MTHDILQRFIFENDPVRGEYIKLQESLHTILQQHDYPAGVQKVLSEALCVAALLSAIIKFKGRLTVQFRGKGKLRLLLAQCDDQNQLRGLAKYDGEYSYEDLMASFKDGVLVIMLDSGSNGQRYQGVVEWVGSSLAESIEHYFQHSEQLATKIRLAVNEKYAVGFYECPKFSPPSRDRPVRGSWFQIVPPFAFPDPSQPAGLASSDVAVFSGGRGRGRSQSRRHPVPRTGPATGRSPPGTITAGHLYGHQPHRPVHYRSGHRRRLRLHHPATGAHKHSPAWPRPVCVALRFDRRDRCRQPDCECANSWRPGLDGAVQHGSPDHSTRRQFPCLAASTRSVYPRPFHDRQM